MTSPSPGLKIKQEYLKGEMTRERSEGKTTRQRRKDLEAESGNVPAVSSRWLLEKKEKNPSSAS